MSLVKAVLLCPWLEHSSCVPGYDRLPEKQAGFVVWKRGRQANLPQWRCRLQGAHTEGMGPYAHWAVRGSQLARVVVWGFHLRPLF